MVERNPIKYKDESFTENTFNSISVLRHEGDNYINASRLCEQGGKSLFNFVKTTNWKQIVESSRKILSTPVGVDVVYDISSDFPNELRGKYVHPDLVHFVAEYVSTEYALKVAHIMRLINEKNKLTGQTINDTVNGMQKEIDDWKEKYGDLEQKTMMIEEENTMIRQENSNLRSRAVPDHFQFKFTYLVYPYKETDRSYKIRFIRRQEANLDEKQLAIIRDKKYWIYDDNLSISTTLNEKILTKVMKQLTYYKLGLTEIELPKRHKDRFIELMRHELFLERIN
jgi:FtsZ-binding cell division protein ZapB